jgi:hypothetical protein
MRTMLNLSVAGGIGVVARNELESLVPRRRLRPWALSRSRPGGDLVAQRRGAGCCVRGAATPPRPTITLFYLAAPRRAALLRTSIHC